MKKMIFWLLLANSAYAQNLTMRWFDPATTTSPVIDGRGWLQELASPYDRLPARAEKSIRPAVWNLSRHCAGEYIQFKTNSNSLVVKYVVKGAQSMPHMPATGVSGLDLYAWNEKGTWNWAKGSWKFGDTIEYRYNNLQLAEYGEILRLYLPLFTSVQWLLIGVPEGKSFTFIPVSDEKPIVAYGTSILHGGCASRPGLAWSNILGRKLNSRIINLGFSGNGQLEEPVIDLLNEQDAKLFILDCMPNLVDRDIVPAAELEKRIRHSITALQSKHPDVPIVLAEHCCGVEGMNLDTAMTKRYHAVSMLEGTIFNKLQKEGVKNIYHVTSRDIGFDMESTVDGTHPNDIGMMQYAEAYYKIIAPLLSKTR